MIEKLDIKNYENKHQLVWFGIINKLNELVEAVNKQQDIIRQIGEWGSEKGEILWCETLTEFNPKPYAKQRKWIWHLCRFWFDNKKQADIGILGEIDEDSCHPYWNVDLGHHYKHCEPVSPDDDIIYKGGKDE